jgi:hypothetical protein
MDGLTFMLMEHMHPVSVNILPFLRRMLGRTPLGVCGGDGARYSQSLTEMLELEDRGSAGRREVQRAAEGPLETTVTPISVWIVITTNMIRYSPRSGRILESWGSLAVGYSLD